MRRGYVALLLAIGLASSTVYGGGDDSAWNAFKSRYRKKYANNTEEIRRRGIWETNLNLIKTHNEQAALGQFTYTLGENELADLSSEEYGRMLGYRSSAKMQQGRVRRSTGMPSMPTYYSTVSVDSLPTYVNWTEQGWVGPVMNQGQCGSCWSYSATGSLQAQYYNNTKQSVQLSQQNLIDCSTDEGNQGCDGGNVQNAFWYVQTNGIETLSTYPDTSNITGESWSSCQFSTSRSVMSVESWMNIDAGSESAQQQAIAFVGPVSVAIDASGLAFQLYSDGIYANPLCSSFFLDHAVTAVGYGTYDGQDYWLLQNSWGTSWGMNGYMMMARNANNMCGIASDSTFPLMNTTGVSVSQEGGSGAEPSASSAHATFLPNNVVTSGVRLLFSLFATIIVTAVA